mgnify:CR=1 FL=1
MDLWRTAIAPLSPAGSPIWPVRGPAPVVSATPWLGDSNRAIGAKFAQSAVTAHIAPAYDRRTTTSRIASPTRLGALSRVPTYPQILTNLSERQPIEFTAIASSLCHSSKPNSKLNPAVKTLYLCSIRRSCRFSSPCKLRIIPVRDRRDRAALT